MWFVLRKIHSLGTSPVPLTFFRILRCRLSRARALSLAADLIFLPLYDPLSGRLAGLAADVLTGVLDSLALVRFGRLKATDVRRDLAYEDLVDPTDTQLRRPIGNLGLDPVRQGELNGMIATQLEDQLAALKRYPVSGARIL